MCDDDVKMVVMVGSEHEPIINVKMSKFIRARIEPMSESDVLTLEPLQPNVVILSGIDCVAALVLVVRVPDRECHVACASGKSQG